jgi:hypothetical protein
LRSAPPTVPMDAKITFDDFPRPEFSFIPPKINVFVQTFIPTILKSKIIIRSLPKIKKIKNSDCQTISLETEKVPRFIHRELKVQIIEEVYQDSSVVNKLRAINLKDGQQEEKPDLSKILQKIINSELIIINLRKKMNFRPK